MGRRELHEHEPAAFPEDAVHLREDPIGILPVMERDDRGDAIERSIGVRDRMCPAFEESDGGPSSTAVRHFLRVRLEDYDFRATACEPLRCAARTATEIEEPDSRRRTDDFTEDREVRPSFADAPPLDGPDAEGHRHPLGVQRLKALFLEAAVRDSESLRRLPYRDRVRSAVRDVNPRDRHGLLRRYAHFGRSARRHRFRDALEAQKAWVRRAAPLSRRDPKRLPPVQCVCAWACWWASVSSGAPSPFGLKLWPQPHVDQLFGLLTTNPLPATLSV